MFTLEHRCMETSIVEPKRIMHNGKVMSEGSATVVWLTKMFRRIVFGEGIQPRSTSCCGYLALTVLQRLASTGRSKGAASISLTPCNCL